MGQRMPRPLKCHILSLKTVVGQLCKPHNMNDERLVLEMEGKTNFLRHLKQFDGLAQMTPTAPDFTTDLRYTYIHPRLIQTKVHR